MKKINLLLMVVFVLMPAICTPAAAVEALRFAWSYYDDAPTMIAGFRLYRDGTIIEQVTIPPDARTVTVPRQTDKKSHAYHLTAYNADDESGPSAVAIDTYVATQVARVDGVLTIEIINQ